ncbi:uncharacterized protein LOC131877808 [Tigriopus californicus]|uniref:uncharacterized protein LOC131877808 n=1 Tax=Tigriopus californicus TaxID=6832 RepID=UPI0027DA0FAF|nr:uncharacterized protein LOC131877808 [Tigriopus californicus]
MNKLSHFSRDTNETIHRAMLRVMLYIDQTAHLFPLASREGRSHCEQLSTLRKICPTEVWLRLEEKTWSDNRHGVLTPISELIELAEMVEASSAQREFSSISALEMNELQSHPKVKFRGNVRDRMRSDSRDRAQRNRHNAFENARGIRSHSTPAIANTNPTLPSGNSPRPIAPRPFSPQPSLNRVELPSRRDGSWSTAPHYPVRSGPEHELQGTQTSHRYGPIEYDRSNRRYSATHEGFRPQSQYQNWPNHHTNGSFPYGPPPAPDHDQFWSMQSFPAQTRQVTYVPSRGHYRGGISPSYRGLGRGNNRFSNRSIPSVTSTFPGSEDSDYTILCHFNTLTFADSSAGLPFLSVSIGENRDPVSALKDSGSNATVIREDLLLDIEMKYTPHWFNTPRTFKCVNANSSGSIVGSVFLSLTFHGSNDETISFYHPCLIATDLSKPFIIGNDILGSAYKLYETPEQLVFNRSVFVERSLTRNASKSHFFLWNSQFPFINPNDSASS